MDLTQLANLGEFIGGVAVVLTLVYLASQIRHGTQVALTANHAAMVGDLRSIQRSIAQDVSLAELLLRGETDPASLSEVDRRRFHEFALSQLEVWEQAFHSWQTRTIDEDTWKGWDEYARMNFATRGHQSVWTAGRLGFFRPFREHVESTVFADVAGAPRT